jgi:hypothetical protein
VTYPVHLVRDVAKHDGGADVAAIEDALTTNAIVLVCWMAIERRTRVRVDGSTITNEATLIVDTRLGTMRRVGGTITGPVSSDVGGPLERFLYVRQHGGKIWQEWGADLCVGAPDRIDVQAADGAIGGIDAEELDAEGQCHVGVVSIDMVVAANWTKGLANIVDGDNHDTLVGLGVLPDGVLGIGIDHDGEGDLAFELVELGGILRLGKGVLVPGDVVDGEVVLFENVFAFGSLTKVIEAKVDATSVGRHAVGEASVLEDSQQEHGRKRRSLTSFI